jgi:flagella basal body P-ring formation protein FlgA
MHAAALLCVLALSPDAVVAQRHVSLASIASVECSDKVMTQTLERLVVANAPRAGAIERLTRETLDNRVRALAPAMRGALQWEGANAVNVRVALAAYDGERIRTAALEQVARALQGRYERLETRAGAVEDLSLPAGEVTLRPRPLALGGRLPSRQPVWIDLHVDGVFHRAVVVPVEIAAYAPVLVAREDLAPGREVLARDFETRSLDVTRVAGEPVTADTALATFRTRKTLHAGDALVREAVEARPAVTRGENVTLQMHAASLQLEATAVALADARIGDMVWIKRDTAGDSLRARVVAPGIVEVPTR